eukprot:gene24985-biopygen13493
MDRRARAPGPQMIWVASGIEEQHHTIAGAMMWCGNTKINSQLCGGIRLYPERKRSVLRDPLADSAANCGAVAREPRHRRVEQEWSKDTGNPFTRLAGRVGTARRGGTNGYCSLRLMATGRLTHGSQDSGAGVARAWRGRGAGYRQFLAWVARAWRGHGL